MRTLLQPKHLRSGATISGDPTFSHAAQFSTTTREAGGEAGAVLLPQCYPGPQKTKAIPAYDVLASHYIARDMMAEACSAAEMTFTLAPWYPPGVGTYAGVLVRAGERQRGDAVVRSLGPRERYGVSIGWARFHLACGELESAAEWFARAIDERYSMVGAFLHSAIAGSLRRSAHWRA